MQVYSSGRSKFCWFDIVLCVFIYLPFKHKSLEIKNNVNHLRLGHRADLGSGAGAAFPTCHALFWLHSGSWRGVRPPLPGRADGHLWLPVPGKHTDPVGHALSSGPREQLCGAFSAALSPGAAVWPSQSEYQTVPSLEEGQGYEGPGRGCCLNFWTINIHQSWILGVVRNLTNVKISAGSEHQHEALIMFSHIVQYSFHSGWLW